MADPVNPNRDAHSNEGPPGMPRWLKGSALVALIVVLTLVVIMVLIGGEHGPGLHTGAGDISDVVAASAIEWQGADVT